MCELKTVVKNLIPNSLVSGYKNTWKQVSKNTKIKTQTICH